MENLKTFEKLRQKNCKVSLVYRLYERGTTMTTREAPEIAKRPDSPQECGLKPSQGINHILTVALVSILQAANNSGSQLPAPPRGKYTLISNPLVYGRVVFWKPFCGSRRKASRSLYPSAPEMVLSVRMTAPCLSFGSTVFSVGSARADQTVTRRQ